MTKLHSVEDAIKQAVDGKECAVCHSRIIRISKWSQKQWDRKRYCSFRCGGIALRERMPVPWNKGIRQLNISGERSHLWKGGIYPINEALRRSVEYRKWRRTVFERDGYACVIGGVEHGNKLNADHIKPFSLFPELRFDVSNGRTLCVSCHRKTDTFGERAKKITVP